MRNTLIKPHINQYCQRFFCSLTFYNAILLGGFLCFQLSCSTTKKTAPPVRKILIKYEKIMLGHPRGMETLEDIDDWAPFTKKYQDDGYSGDVGETPYPWWPNDIFMITDQKDEIKEHIIDEDSKIIVENMLNFADQIYYQRKTIADDTNGWSPTIGSEAGSYFKSTVTLLKDVFSPINTIEPEDLHYKIQSKFDVFSLGAVMSYDLSQWKALGEPPEELSNDISNLINKMLNAHPYERITIKDAYVEMSRIIEKNF